jgi:hypothetical protein
MEEMRESAEIVRDDLLDAAEFAGQALALAVECLLVSAYEKYDWEVFELERAYGFRALLADQWTEMALLVLAVAEMEEFGCPSAIALKLLARDEGR